MITVYHYTTEKGFSLSVSGHAGAAPKGQDIVCAGVSALVMALIDRVQTLCRYHTIATIDDGVKIEGGMEAIESFYTAIKGIDLIACHYPAYVKITEG